MSGKTSENRERAVAQLAARLGLTGDADRFGPGDHVSLVPTEEADHLAHLLAARSLAPLRAAQKDGTIPLASVYVGDVENPAGKWPRTKQVSASLSVQPAATALSAPGATLGIPLLTAICPDIVEVALTRLIPARLAPQENPNRPPRADLGFELVQLEADLWAIAARHDGPSRTMPYATRIRALRWWWEPRPGRERRPTICIRCGSIVFTSAKRSRLPAPFCGHCVKAPSFEHPRAIAPASKGTWWIRCGAPECSKAFEAPLQARYCDEHRLAHIAPSHRASARPS